MLCCSPHHSSFNSNNVSYLANGAETTRFRQFRLLCHFSPLWIITFYLAEMGDPNHVLLVTTSKKWPLSKCSKLKLLHKTFGGLPKVFFISKHRSTPFYIPYQVCLFFYEITFSILLLKCSKRFINDSYYICIYALKRSVFSNIT